MGGEVDLHMLGEQIRHLQTATRQAKEDAFVDRSVTERELAALQSRVERLEISLADFTDYIDERTLDLLDISFQALKDEIKPLLKV